VFGDKPKRLLEMAIDGEIEVAVADPIIQEVRRHLLGKFGSSRTVAISRVSCRSGKTVTMRRMISSSS
jgi:hypothetical protein